MDPYRTKRMSTFHGVTRPTSALPPTSKRGVTPSKTEAKEQQSPPKITFTAQQQLDILERLEKGDFVRGAGLQQFYKEAGSADAGPSTKKNLLSEFDKLQNSGPGMAGPTLSSTKLSEATDKEEATDFDMNPCINLMEYGIHEQNPEAYPCLDFLDSIIVQYEINIRHMMTLCRIRNEAAFAKLMPPHQFFNLFYRMDAITRTVKKFMKKSEMERARLFLPPATFGGQRGNDGGKSQEAKNEIQVDVLDQQNFFKAFEKLPGFMEWIQKVLKRFDSSESLDKRAGELKNIITKMFKLVEALEESLTRMEANDAENLDLCDKILDCEEDDASHTTTTSDYSPISDMTP